MLLEDLEGIREKADLVPHAGAFERDQRDALLRADGLYLRCGIACLGAQHRAFELRRLSGVHMQRNAVMARRQNAAGVQDFRAARGDFLSFVIVQRTQQARRRRRARVGAEHAGHVGPDLEPLRAQLGGEVRCRGIGASAAEQHGVAIVVARNEALCDNNRRQDCKPLLQRRIRSEVARGRQHACFSRGAATFLGFQHGPCIDPCHIQPLSAQITCSDLSGHQLAG